MPQRKTAKKELKKTKKRKLKNLQVKNNVKTAIKNFKRAIETADKPLGAKTLSELYKALDKAATKKVIHKNLAARKKSRLSKLLAKKPEK
jgi:small subunit ribosomal protein S20